MPRAHPFSWLACSLLLAGGHAAAQRTLGITATESAGAFRQQPGGRITLICPATDEGSGAVYGTETYADVSAICVAAIHAGVLRPREPGIVTIVIGSGASSFTGARRNGVTSQDYGRLDYSFTFAQDGVPGTITWTTVWKQVPVGFVEPVAVMCPAGGTLAAPVWGADVYTADSAICVAAVHAGVIGTQVGGAVAVTRVPALSDYAATDRNGVMSRRWGPWPDAFNVVATAAVPLSTQLEACPLTSAVARTFAAMKASVTTEYAVLDPTAQATAGFDAATLAAQRDALLRELDQLERQNSRDSTAACADTFLAVRPTTDTNSPAPVAGSGVGAAAGARLGTRSPGTNPAPSAPAEPQTAPSSAGEGRQIAGVRGNVVAEPGGGAALETNAPGPSGPPGPPPADFRVTGYPGVAELRWTNAESATNYRLFRTGPGAVSIEIPLQRRAFTDGALNPIAGWFAVTPELFDAVQDLTVTYRYRLVAEYANGTVGEALASWLSPPPVNPTNFRARASAPDTVTLEWDRALGAIEYRIDGTGLPITGLTATQTTATVALNGGGGSWQIVALYPGAADYANRPTATVTVTPIPGHAPAWLSMHNGTGNSTDTGRHYARLCNPNEVPRFARGCEGRNVAAGTLISTILDSWGAPDAALAGPQETTPGVASRTGTEAVRYRNVTDLGQHRNTMCYFSQPELRGGLICHTDSEQAVSLIIMTPEGARFASFEWGPATDADYGAIPWGTRLRLKPTATFDSEGPKLIPHACIACHGGRYDPVTGLVTGASLLPIDPSLVELEDDRATGEETIRRINSIIRQSYSSPAVAAYIEGLYGGVVNGQRRVDVPGALAIPNYVPQGWTVQQSNLYLDFVKKDCAMCHLAGPAHLNFLSASNLMANKTQIHAAVCGAHSMPHAEVSFRRFWTSGSGTASGPGWFAAALGFPSC